MSNSKSIQLAIPKASSSTLSRSALLDSMLKNLPRQTSRHSNTLDDFLFGANLAEFERDFYGTNAGRFDDDYVDTNEYLEVGAGDEGDGAERQDAERLVGLDEDGRVIHLTDDDLRKPRNFSAVRAS